MVIPSRPDESELWQLVRHGEMPPPDAPSGALTATDKEAIRAWIEAGAPAEDGPPASPTAPPRDTAEPPHPSPAARALGWLGKFHLLLVHFPIALLAAAGLAELWSLRRGQGNPSLPARFCLCLGAAAALPTVALGFVHALGGSGAGAPGLLALHRWVGTATGVVAVAAAALSERDARRGIRSRCALLVTFVAVLLVALAGHFGGLLTHGRDFFDW
jgi:uncharacterized membrane protein